jgi:hypothetical protein
MDSKVAAQYIEAWRTSGELSPKQVLCRLDKCIDEYYTFNADEEAALQEMFQSHCKNTADSMSGAVLDENEFLALMQRRAGLPPTPAGTEAGCIIFGMLLYLRNTPFAYRHLDDKPESGSRSLSTRALAWLLPERHTQFTEAGSLSRARTAADHRRLIFQSLATATTTPLTEPHDKAEERARRNAFDMSPEKDSQFSSRRDFASVNYDADGDEMFHDVLDVLYLTLLRPGGLGLAPIRRDGFRAVTKDLLCRRNGVDGEVSGQQAPRLCELTIPQERLATLFKLALALRKRHEVAGSPNEDATATRPLGMECSAEAARDIMNIFCGRIGDDLVTWPMFDDAMQGEAVCSYLRSE